MRLVDADALLKDKYLTRWDGYAVRERDILSAPTVDAVPVVHGKWLLHSSYNPCDSHQCSVCGIVLSEWSSDMKGLSYYREFCPRCGARMDGDADAAD